MIFADTMPFAEAMQSRAVRQLLPTDFRTRLLDTIPAELRQRAMFSAGVTNAEFLQEASDSVDELLAGKTDRATKRAGLKQLLDRLEYRPVEGEEGSLTDLSSDKRLNLILDTNLQQAQGFGYREQGMSPEVLAAFPCWEFFDTNPGQTENRRNWRKIWADNGGHFYDGRMIARKDDPIWKRINRFGVDYAPFDFGSFWDVQDVSHSEAVELGVITEEERVAPVESDFNTDLQATPEVRSAALKEALSHELRGVGQFIGGVLRYIGRAA